MSIRTAGGIEAIVACITAHPGSVVVAENACGAMVNLADNAENQVCVFSVVCASCYVAQFTVDSYCFLARHLYWRRVDWHGGQLLLIFIKQCI